MRKLLVIILALSLFSLKAQDTIPSFRFDHLGVEEGLSQNYVLNFHQDEKGLIWIGTWDGLNRYDGYGFTLFLPGYHINTLVAVPQYDSLFWIGTDLGVIRFNPKNGKHSLLKGLKAPVSHIKLINGLVDNSQSLIVVSRNKLYELDKDEFTLKKTFKNEITAFTHHGSTLWIGTEAGEVYSLSISDLDNERRIHQNENQISALHIVSGSLLIGTQGGNRFWKYRINGDKETDHPFYKEDNDDIHKPTTANRFYWDKEQGRLWIATNKGLLIESEKQADHFNLFNSSSRHPLLTRMRHNEVRALFKDQSGVMWVGTFGGGITKIVKRKKFYAPLNLPQSEAKNNVSDTYNTEEEAKNRHIRAISEDVWGYIWYGTENGKVYRYKSENGKIINTERKPIEVISFGGKTKVYSIIRDRSRKMWVATDKGHLVRFDPSSDPLKSDYTDTLDYTLKVILQDVEKPEILWLGTVNNGLLKYDLKDSSIVRLLAGTENTKDSLHHNYVYCLYQEPDSRKIWIGTRGGGLSLYDPVDEKIIDTYRSGTDSTSLSNDKILAITQDETDANILWIATYGGGLNRFDKKEKSFKSEYKLIPKSVYGVLQDSSESSLWLSSNRGLIKFKPELDEPGKEQVLFFDMGDGLQNLEFNGGAYYKSPSGQFYFGGINGINEFQPKNITLSQQYQDVVFTHLVIDGKPKELSNLVFPFFLSYADTITIAPDQRNFEVHFTSPDYAAPDRIRYRYKLYEQGQREPEQWTDLNYTNYFTYTSERGPGSYILKVESTNSDGVWPGEVNSSKKLNLLIKASYSEEWKSSIPWIIGAFIFSLLWTVILLIGRHFLLSQKSKLRERINIISSKNSHEEVITQIFEDLRSSSATSGFPSFSHQRIGVINPLNGQLRIISQSYNYIKELFEVPQEYKKIENIQDWNNVIRSREKTLSSLGEKSYTVEIHPILQRSDQYQTKNLPVLLLIELNTISKIGSQSYKNLEIYLDNIAQTWKRLSDSYVEGNLQKAVEVNLNDQYPNSFDEKGDSSPDQEDQSTYYSSQVRRNLSKLLGAKECETNVLTKTNLFESIPYLKSFQAQKTDIYLDLHIDNHNLGYISLQLDEGEERPFIQNEELLRWLGSLISRNYQRIRLLDAISKAVSPLQMLSSDNEVISSEFLEIIENYFCTSYVSVWLPDPVKDKRVFKQTIATRAIEESCEKYGENYINKIDLPGKTKLINLKVKNNSNSLFWHFGSEVINASHLIHTPILDPDDSSKILGFINIFLFYKYKNLSVDDNTFLSIIKDKILKTIKTASLLKSYSEISEAFVQTDIARVLDRIIEAGKNVLDADLINIFRKIPTEDKVLYKDGYLSDNLEEPELIEIAKQDHAENRIANEMINQDDVWIESEEAYMDRFKGVRENRVNKTGKFAEDYWTREKLQSMAAIRLMRNDANYGVIFINYRTSKKFTPFLKSLIRSFAAIATNAYIITTELEKRDRDRKSLHRSFLVFWEKNTAKGLLHDANTHFVDIHDKINIYENKIESIAENLQNRRALLNEARNFIFKIEDPIERLKHKFQDIIRYYQTGNLPEKELNKLKLSWIIHNSVENIQHYLRGISLSIIGVDITFDGIIKCYPNDLKDAIENLLKNAIQSVGNKKKGYVRISTGKRQNHIYIKISDNGPGIPKDIRQDIINPFYTTKQESGSGLGLTNVIFTIEELGGNLDYGTNARTKLTHFEIRLPLNIIIDTNE